jgi:Ni,Fe-hydrogenase III small subunit
MLSPNLSIISGALLANTYNRILPIRFKIPGIPPKPLTNPLTPSNASERKLFKLIKNSSLIKVS